MDLTGRFLSITKDFITNKFIVSLSVDNDVSQGYEELKECECLDITIKKHRKKRSLDANAYYWVLLSKIAEKLRSSKEEVHNLMLSRYGQIDRDEEGQAIIFSLLERIDISKHYDLHAKPVGSGTVDGKQFVHYAMLKGSHLYDTGEMSILIEGVVSEAKELGIETMTPDELKRMVEAWRPKS